MSESLTDRQQPRLLSQQALRRRLEAPTKCGDTSRRGAAGNYCARRRARRRPFARRDKARRRLQVDCVTELTVTNAQQAPAGER